MDEISKFRDDVLALIEHDAKLGLGSTRKTAADTVEHMEAEGLCTEEEAARWLERLRTPIGELRGVGLDDDFWSGLFRSKDFADYVITMIAAHRVMEEDRGALAELAKS